MADRYDRPGEDYVIAHEGRDGDIGCPLYQHLCGQVSPLSRMEAIGVPAAGDLQPAVTATGMACPQCGQDPQPQAWRLLRRKRSPDDTGRV